VSDPAPLTVLGPQRRPSLAQVVQTLEPDAPLATVTAGWEEREPEDDGLQRLLGGRGTNLGLYGRWLDVLERDREFAVAARDHDAVLDELQQLYLVQLDAALGALYAVARRGDVRPRTMAAALADAEAVVRLVDQRHLTRVARAQEAFETAWRPAEREVVARHTGAVRDMLEPAAAMIVAGGHVGVLVRVMHLFQVARRIPAGPPRRVIAWSAGAMALTDRVLLFNDRAPQGPAHPEFYAAGLGIVPGSVLLPHARRRLRLDDRTRTSALARRCAPAQCVVLDDGVRIDIAADGTLPPGTRVIGPDGHVVALEPP
jgi:hypothetical protein